MTDPRFSDDLIQLMWIHDLRRIGEVEAMITDQNPLAGIENILFSRHAMFVMKERGTSVAEIVQDIRSPNADVSVDRKTGHFIFRKGLSRIVVKKGNKSNAKVITVFTGDGGQGQHA